MRTSIKILFLVVFAICSTSLFGQITAPVPVAIEVRNASGHPGLMELDSLLNYMGDSTGALTLNPKLYTIVVSQDGTGDFDCPGGANADTSITKALAAAADSTGGGTVFIKRGTYVLVDSINIPGNDVVIQGEKHGTVLQVTGNDDYAFVATAARVRFGLVDLIFEGDADSRGIIQTTAATCDSFFHIGGTVRGFLAADATVYDSDTNATAWVIDGVKFTGNYTVKFAGKASDLTGWRVYDAVNDGITMNGEFNRLTDFRIERFGRYGIAVEEYGPLIQSAAGGVMGTIISDGHIRWATASSSKRGINIVNDVYFTSVSNVVISFADSSSYTTVGINSIGAGIYITGATDYGTHIGDVRIFMCDDGIYTASVNTYIVGGLTGMCTDGIHIAAGNNGIVGFTFAYGTNGLNIASGDKNGFDGLIARNCTNNVVDSGTNTIAGDASGVLDVE